MKVLESGRTSIVGLSASNILHQSSDPKLAQELILARIDHVLNSPNHRRETTAEFEIDWAAMAVSRQKNPTTLASTGGGTRVQDAPVPPAE